MRPAVIVIALVAASAFAGCVAQDESKIVLAAFMPLVDGSPGREVAWAVFVNNTGGFREDLSARVVDAPAGWSARVEPEFLALPGLNTSTVTVRVLVPADARHGLSTITLGVGDARLALSANVAAASPEEARAGAGAKVFTVGYWDNGTVFYTNWKAVNDSASLARGDLGSEWNFDPLKIYLGGKQGERAPEPYNSSGYSPVIAGFDKGVRGARVGETRVVHLAPEDAYTREGRESHPLYGDALHFVIKLVSVDFLEAPRPTDPVTCPLPVCPML